MSTGWRRTARAVVITATLVSAFWVLLGAWWLSRHEWGEPAVLFASSASDAAAPGAPATAAATTGAVDSAPAFVNPATRLVLPVVGVRPGQLIDTYTQSRDGGARPHNAIDIMAPRGTVVVAAAAGRVDKLFLSRQGGNTVYIRAPDGRVIYYYAHLDSYAPNLREGMRVAAGQAIGTVGSTGNASPDGPHLHFAIMRTTPAANWSEGDPVNPYPLLTRR